MRPQLPALDKIAPYLQEIDERRWYTNFGPLAARLEERLANHFLLPAGNIIARLGLRRSMHGRSGAPR